MTYSLPCSLSLPVPLPPSALNRDAYLHGHRCDCRLCAGHQNMVRTLLICCLLLLEDVNSFVVPAGEMPSFVLRRFCVRA